MDEDLRIDMIGGFKGAIRTDAGDLRVPAYFTRTGIFTYLKPDGSTVRELRHPDDVFHADSLSTLKSCTLTIDHPVEREVNAKNYRRVTIGRTGEDIRVERDKYVGGEFLVQDAEAVTRVDNGELCEASAGYRCKFDNTPGKYNGEDYDRRQHTIRYNHVAIGPRGWGRAGRDVGVRSDSLYSTSMDLELELRIDSAADPAVTPVAPMQVLDASKFVSKAEHDKLQAKCDSLETALKTAQESAVKADSLTSPAALDVLVQERSLVIDSARALAGKDIAVAGKSNADIMVAALGKALPELKLDGKSSDYVLARFEAEASRALKVGVATKTADEITSPGTVKSDSNEDKGLAAKRAMNERNAKRSGVA